MSRVQPLNNVVAWRCSDFDKIRLDALKATFSDPTVRSVFEWLFAQPEVRTAIERRMTEASQPKRLVEVLEPGWDDEPDESVFSEYGYAPRRAARPIPEGSGGRRS